jgi:hypothetical protein
MFEFPAAFDSSPDEPACSRQAWMQLYERMTPDEVDVIFWICGYEVSPTGELSRRYITLELGEAEKAVLEARAKSHGRTPEIEASGILTAELRRGEEENP